MYLSLSIYLSISVLLPPYLSLYHLISSYLSFSLSLSSLLESKWIWVFLAFIILILLCILAYCFRDQLAIIVAFIETCLYHLTKLILLPLKILKETLKACFYPFKQMFFGLKEKGTRMFHPYDVDSKRY
jgi:hypothetical protein